MTKRAMPLGAIVLVAGSTPSGESHVFCVPMIHVRVCCLRYHVCCQMRFFKLRDELERTAENRKYEHKILRSLFVTPSHTKARSEYPKYPDRAPVPDHAVRWEAAWRPPGNVPTHGTSAGLPTSEGSYVAVSYTSDYLEKFQSERPNSENWADMEDYTVIDFSVRHTYERGGSILFEHELGMAKINEGSPVGSARGPPLNPRGRTGICGRGLLGKWGPNQAADAIFTRRNPKQPADLQMIAVLRVDTNEWACPGGFVFGEGEDEINTTILDRFLNEVMSPCRMRAAAFPSKWSRTLLGISAVLDA